MTSPSMTPLTERLRVEAEAHRDEAVAWQGESERRFLAIAALLDEAANSISEVTRQRDDYAQGYAELLVKINETSIALDRVGTAKLHVIGDREKVVTQRDQATAYAIHLAELLGEASSVPLQGDHFASWRTRVRAALASAPKGDAASNVSGWGEAIAAAKTVYRCALCHAEVTNPGGWCPNGKTHVIVQPLHKGNSK